MPRAARVLSTAFVVLALAACTDVPDVPETPEVPSSAPSAAGTTASLVPADTPTCLPDGTATVTTGPQDDPTLVSFAGAGTQGVILAPQNQGDACQWADELARLAGAGYLVASFGWSSDGAASFVGAVDVLRGLGATDVALVGASKGGTYAAAFADDVDAVSVVALGPPATFEGLDAQSGASSFTGPLLVIATTDDRNVSLDSSREVARADDPTTFLELSGAAHGVELFTSEHQAQVQEAVDATLAAGFAS